MKKFKSKLTLKVFVLTSILLVLVSLLSVFCMAKYVPKTYTTQLSKDLQKKINELGARLETKSRWEDCIELIDSFAIKTGTEVSVYDSKGDSVYSAGETNIDFDHDIVAVMYDVIDDYQEIENDLLTEKSFEIILKEANEKYTVCVQGNMKVINQTVEAIKNTVPFILIGVAVLSLLCSLLYSYYITSPILKLSRISEKMAQLDFNVSSDIVRKDEIGVLSYNLNELSSKLAKTLKDLQESNEVLKYEITKEKELEKRKQDFFSAASHDLKTPITILLGHLNGILDGAGDYKDSRQYIERSIVIAEQMNEMVQSLLLIARMENSMDSLELKRTDLSAVIRRIISEMICLMEKKEQQLEVKIPEHLFCMINADMMSRVIRNVLSNAIQYSPQKGKIIIAMVLNDDRDVYFTMENTGVRIPEDSIPHLFDPFFRIDNSRSKNNGGNGLGLYIVKILLDKHHASYKICNTENGVQFSYMLSLVEHSLID